VYTIQQSYEYQLTSKHWIRLGSERHYYIIY